MTFSHSPTRIDCKTKQNLKIMLIAKNALWDGLGKAEDGNHATYHVEIREVLREIGLQLDVQNKFEVLFQRPDTDFVFPLLNRAGFFNSEMLCPLLCERLSIPYLGASPILRGLSDDKHLAKLVAKNSGVQTAPWAIYRRGTQIDSSLCPKAERYVVKPNNSSASWGVKEATDWPSIQVAINEVHDIGHDALVEPFIDGSDVEVPVITNRQLPVIMPMMIFRQADPSHLRTYQEKRDLVDRRQKYSLDPFHNPSITNKIESFTQKLIFPYQPFDYGRWEFRVNEDTGEISFLELNLNCNLWSQKVFGRSATLAGWEHSELIENILAESLVRHNLMSLR
jgi:D-alanine-D-alanine ligase